MDRFGANIAFLRKKLGWSQEDLAKRLDVKRTTISNYEMGISMPPYKTLRKIANLFGVDIHGLTAEDLSNRGDMTIQFEEEHYSFRMDDSFNPKADMKRDFRLLTSEDRTKLESESPVLNENLTFLKEKLSISEFHKIMDSEDVDKHIQVLVNEIERLRDRLRSLESTLSFIKRYPVYKSYYESKDSDRSKDSDIFIKSDSVNE